MILGFASRFQMQGLNKKQSLKDCDTLPNLPLTFKEPII